MRMADKFLSAAAMVLLGIILLSLSAIVGTFAVRLVIKMIVQGI